MKKLIWALVLIGLVGAGSAAAWRRWKLAQTNALPAGIVSGNGRIESIQVDVAAKYGGRIKDILAREGDLVEEGQVLAKMDTSELEAELAKYKANVAESRSKTPPRSRPRSRKRKPTEAGRCSNSARSQNLFDAKSRRAGGI